jgi:preprotein translocase subunit SecD
MRLRSIIAAFLLALFSITAHADRPTIDVRLVVDSGGSELPARDGGRVRLGPSLVPPPFAIERAVAHGAAVELELAPATARAFAAATAREKGHRAAIVVDGVVQDAPVIREAVTGGRVLVTLRSPAEAQQLARALAGQ